MGIGVEIGKDVFATITLVDVDKELFIELLKVGDGVVIGLAVDKILGIVLGDEYGDSKIIWVFSVQEIKLNTRPKIEKTFNNLFFNIVLHKIKIIFDLKLIVANIIKILSKMINI